MKKKIYLGVNNIKELTLEECINECYDLAHGSIIKKWIKSYEEDDLVQMAYIGIMKAYNEYKPEYESPFVQFAIYYIKREFNAMITKDNRIKRGGLVSTISIYNKVDSFRDNTEDIINTITYENDVSVEDYVVEKISNTKLRQAIELLNEDYKDILNKHYVMRMTYQQIAIQRGVTRQAIQTKIRTIKEILRESIDSNYKRQLGKKGRPRIEDKRTYIGISPKGEKYRFNDIRVFSEKNNLSQWSIRKVVQGITKTHKGWKFTIEE